MKTSLRSVTRALLQALPHYRAINGYLYRVPARHTLRGVVLDPGLEGVYLSTFLIPLFDKPTFLHLSLGDRFHFEQLRFVDEGRNRSASEIVPSLLRAIEGARVPGGDGSVEDCANDLRPIADRNEYAKKSLALCSIFVGEYDVAGKLLDDLIVRSGAHESGPIKSGVLHLRSLLSDGNGEAARKQLEIWESESIEKFGIVRDAAV